MVKKALPSFTPVAAEGDVVKISSFSEDWYGSTYDGARRPY